MITAVKTARREFDVSAVERALASGLPGHVQAAVGPVLASLHEELTARARPMVADLLQAAGDAAARAIPRKTKSGARAAEQSSPNPFVMEFDGLNAAAVRWAKERSAGLVVDITEDARAAIREVMHKAFVEGLPPVKAARLIEQLVGLDGPRQAALLAFQQTDATERQVAKYAAELLRARAITIARTETIAASTAGQLQLWEQAVESGFLGSGDEMAWLVTDDDRLCPICEPLDDDRAPIGGTFRRSGLSGPPAHPQCRCAVAIVLAEDVAKQKDTGTEIHGSGVPLDLAERGAGAGLLGWPRLSVSPDFIDAEVVP